LGKKQSQALDDAKAWASANFGVVGWIRDPFGDWQDKRVIDAMVEKLNL
jgi:hypothetical protein